MMQVDVLDAKTEAGDDSSFEVCNKRLANTDWLEVVYGNIEINLLTPSELLCSEFSNSIMIQKFICEWIN